MPLIICDVKAPERLAEALKLVAILARGDRAEIGKFPLCAKRQFDDRGYYQALQATAAHENLYWMIVAREQWLELAIEKWEEWADANAARLPEIFDVTTQVPRDEVDGAGYNLVTQYLNPAWVLESHKLADLFLAVLTKFPHGEGTPNRQEIISLLQRRTGCRRQHDPHRNELAFNLLMKHYGLT